MTNKIFKSAILDFSVSAQNAKANVPAIKFSTQDSGGTARLNFTAKKEVNSLPLSSAAEVTLAMIMSVGKEYESKYVVNPEITNRTKGVFEYSLTDDQISHDGQVNAELYVKYPNQSMQIHRFSFVIEKAMIDDNFFPVATYYVERWDDYEKIFNDSVARLSTKLDELDEKADNLQIQFDSMNSEQFAQKTDLNAHVNNVDIHVTAAEKTSWSAKESTSGAQSKADKALADAKTDASTKYNAATIESKAYTDDMHKETLVWSGSSYFLETHSFSWDIAKVKHGVLLEFSRYIPGTGVQDYGYIQYFFSKEYLVRNNNKATWLNMPGAIDGAKKTVRLTPASVSGDAANGQAPSTSYALRTVAIF